MTKISDQRLTTSQIVDAAAHTALFMCDDALKQAHLRLKKIRPEYCRSLESAHKKQDLKKEIFEC